MGAIWTMIKQSKLNYFALTPSLFFSLLIFRFYCEGGVSGREIVLVYQTCFFLSERNLTANAVQSCLCSVS